VTEGGTCQENFCKNKGQTGPLQNHVASRYRWRAEVSEQEAAIPE